MPDNPVAQRAPRRALGDSIGRLLRRIELGDKTAFDQLLKRISETVIAEFRRWYGSRPRPVSDEDDLSQDLFIDLWQGILAGRFASIHFGLQFWDFLYRALKLRIYLQHRRERRRKRGGEIAHTGDPAVMAEVPSTAPPVDAVVAFEDELAHLMALLDDESCLIAHLWLDGYALG